MSYDQKIITEKVHKQMVNTINLVEASLKDIASYDPKKEYDPKEQEPYDALCDRFIRAVEIGLKFFRSYERLIAENSETLRDILNRMAKLDWISSTELWLKMRDVRNRIVHDYLPEDIAEIYEEIAGVFGGELSALKAKEIKV
ncbi:hypothetical protein MNBD_UNCLBAC01-1338 [hydrothermal vent metagenome]|uniref:DUF86 domain-containing protein n=1 Tax=hydrothermal vent metagenome TaxID=652676 RepID=A0A3B1DGQ8_9ZZZZ